MGTKTNKKAYVHPETEAVPCMIPTVMEPSIHARGNNWLDGGTEELGFGSYTGSSGSSSGSFRFKSVWDATAKELRDGELVEVPID